MNEQPASEDWKIDHTETKQMGKFWVVIHDNEVVRVGESGRQIVRVTRDEIQPLIESLNEAEKRLAVVSALSIKEQTDE